MKRCIQKGRALAALGAIFLGARAFSAMEVLCPRFVLTNSRGVTFSDAEKRLICGDPKTPGWKLIPANQALFWLKTFLQARGYYDPTIEERNGAFFIDPGRPRVTTKFIVEGGPPELRPDRMRHIVGEILTPGLLNKTAERITARLKVIGYPCAKVKMEAATDTGTVLARVTQGPRETIFRVDEDPLPGVLPGIMTRYYAFELGELYDEELFLLTRQRIMNDAVVQGTFFETKCTPDGSVSRQKFIAGPPRVVTVGFGANTEKGPVLRAGWTNSRMGDTASLVNVIGTINYRQQSVTASSNWYAAQHPSRYYLRPTVSVTRDNEQSADTLTAQAQGAIAATYDTQHFGGSYAIGPAMNVVRTWRGEGPPTTEFLSLGIEGRATSHTFELYSTSPREGFDVRLTTNIARDGWVSGFSAVYTQLAFEKLWNPWSFDPPLFVFGVRGLLGVTGTGEAVTSPVLPDTYKQRLGGSTTLRGFGRRSVPSGEGSQGALTVAYVGAELRFADVLTAGFQPVAFVDFGKVGLKSFQLDGTLYWSPGFGVRWQSPIGVLRATLAQGIIEGPGEPNDPSTGLQFYFSFGEEF